MLEFEKKFIEKLTQQDKTVFSKFYLDTVDYFFRYLIGNYPTLPRSDIDDILAGFYLKIWKNAGKYKEQENFKAYIWTVLKNHLKDYFKKKKDLSFSQMDWLSNNFTDSDTKASIEDSLASQEDITELMESNFKKEKIQEAINRLPESEKEVFFLKFVEQKKYQEIAEMLEIQESAVRQRLSRAVKKLQRKLKY